MFPTIVATVEAVTSAALRLPSQDSSIRASLLFALFCWQQTAVCWLGMPLELESSGVGRGDSCFTVAESDQTASLASVKSKVRHSLDHIYHLWQKDANTLSQLQVQVR